MASNANTMIENDKAQSPGNIIKPVANKPLKARSKRRRPEPQRRRKHQRIIKTLREAYRRQCNKYQELEIKYNNKSNKLQDDEDLLPSLKGLVETYACIMLDQVLQ